MAVLKLTTTMNKIKVLLTGGSGMVGKNITELKPDSVTLFTPSIKELNLLDYNCLNKYIYYHKPEIIIHAAGIVGGIQANINHPVRFLRENTLMAHNVIWAAYENRVPYLINLGSSCMYPFEAENPLSENAILTGALEQTNEGYALAKIFAQRFCSYINRECNNHNYKTIIPCNLYGKYDKFDVEWGHMIPSVIHKIHQAKINNKKQVTIWGNGEARREFIYAADFADFIWSNITKLDKIPEVLNIGLGYDYSINEYYQAIAEVIGYKGSFVHDTTKPVGMKQKLVDTTLLNSINWSSKTGLKEGIQKTYNYYLENQNNEN